MTEKILIKRIAIDGQERIRVSYKDSRAPKELRHPKTDFWYPREHAGVEPLLSRGRQRKIKIPILMQTIEGRFNNGTCLCEAVEAAPMLTAYAKDEFYEDLKWLVAEYAWQYAQQVAKRQ